jgi:hypothetical protein
LISNKWCEQPFGILNSEELREGPINCSLPVDDASSTITVYLNSAFHAVAAGTWVNTFLEPLDLDNSGDKTRWDMLDNFRGILFLDDVSANLGTQGQVRRASVPSDGRAGHVTIQDQLNKSAEGGDHNVVFGERFCPTVYEASIVRK